MTDRKFYARLCVVVLLFLAVFGSGCGGGGGGGESGESGGGGESVEIPNSSPNDTSSQPFDLDPNSFAVDDALSTVAITYADGDSPSYVTRNLGLPSSSEGLPVTWTTSNAAALSANGNVTRPSGSNARVILTASVVSGDFRSAKSFDLTVIQARSRTIEQAKAHELLAVEDIEAMNESDDNYEISYSDSGEVLRHVDGKFTDVPVKNADDALDALQSLHEVLGIDDPYEQLALMNTARDDFGAQYSFKQVYSYSNETLEVYGRTVMLSANASGDADFLSSSFIEGDRLNDVYTRYTSEQAESAALGHYAGETGIAVVSADTRRVIYSLGEFEAEPVIAFVVRVTGSTSQGDIDDTVIVNGVDLSVISATSNIRTWTITDTGRDELGELRTFPVTVNVLLNKYLRDNGTPEVQIYSADVAHPVRVRYGTSWTDRAQISAYTNLRTVMKWWRDTFNRNSLDNKGMTVKLITHFTSMNDNACWMPSSEVICVGDIGRASLYDHTRAIGLDTLTHETTHAVISYATGGLPYKNATGAIDDGYADIFGCLRDRDWRHGWRTANDTTNPELGITYFIDKTKCLRDARENVTVSSLSGGTLSTLDDLYHVYETVTPNSYTNDNNGCHTYCRLVTHAAYLMHRDSAGSNGLTWDELGRAWYKSISMGLDATSNFQTVRRNVLRAAKQMGLNEWKLQTIRSAFDRVGITVPHGTLRAQVVDADTWLPIAGANVQLLNPTIPRLYEGRHTDADGYAVLSSDAGSYRVMAYASGYKYKDFRQYLTADKTTRIMIEMVREGTASLDLYIRDENMNLVSGANLRLSFSRGNVDMYIEDVTDSNGRHTFINLPTDYYTLRVRKTGYYEHVYSIPISPGMNYVAEYIYPESQAKYLVYLYDKGSNDFRSNLKGSVYDGTNFHLHSGNAKVFLSNGRPAAEFQAYDSAECIRFTKFSASSYAYYVTWEGASKPDWFAANIYVNLYYKGRIVRRYFPPRDSTSGEYWKAFDISARGIRHDVNEIFTDAPEAD